MNKLDIITAKDAAADLSMIYASTMKGEPFHPAYKKDKDIFRRLIRSEMKLKRDLRNHFKQLATDIIPYINWYQLDQKIRTADEYEDMISYDFEQEERSLVATLMAGLVMALWAGGDSAAQEFGIPVDWSPTSSSLQEYVNARAVEIAVQLTETTTSRIINSLRSSYSNGETIEEAIARIITVVGDARRAETIARTESINAFAEGRMEAGRIMGATHKEWSATYKACPICAPLDGTIVKLDDMFKSGNLEVLRPAAHPNCRCYIRLSFNV